MRCYGDDLPAASTSQGRRWRSNWFEMDKRGREYREANGEEGYYPESAPFLNGSCCLHLMFACSYMKVRFIIIIFFPLVKQTGTTALTYSWGEHSLRVIARYRTSVCLSLNDQKGPIISTRRASVTMMHVTKTRMINSYAKLRPEGFWPRIIFLFPLYVLGY